MNIWKVLEIEPTVEIKEIKRAYAKKLKINNPEDDAEGFQIIKEAYDIALKYAKNNKKSLEENSASIESSINLDSTNSEETINVFKSEEIYKVSNNREPLDLKSEAIKDKVESDSYSIPPKISIKQDIVHMEDLSVEQIESFLERVQAIYDDFDKRIDVKYWNELLSDEIMWQFELKSQIVDKMVEFLVEHYCLPREVFKLFSLTFQLDREELYANKGYPEEIVLYIFKQLSVDDRVPSYRYLHKEAGIDFSEYVKYRDDAFIALMNDELGKARKLILLASEMYDRDPELICLNAEYFLRINDEKSAEVEFKAAIEIDPNDMSIYLFQAKTFADTKRFSKAIEIYKFLVERTEDNLELKKLLGKCYFDNLDIVNAGKVLREVLELSPEDTDARYYLTRIIDLIYAQYEGDNSKKITADIKREYKKVRYALKGTSSKKETISTIKTIGLLFFILFWIIAIVRLVFGIDGGRFLMVAVTMNCIYAVYKSFKNRKNKEVKAKKVDTKKIKTEEIKNEKVQSKKASNDHTSIVKEKKSYGIFVRSLLFIVKAIFCLIIFLMCVLKVISAIKNF